MTEIDCKQDLPLCKCGCGQHVKNRKYSYLENHHKRYTPEDVIEKLLSNYSEDVDGCWNWTGARRQTPNGEPAYGRLAYRGKGLYAHRASYMMFVGPIPQGMCVCHSCDNPGCINPKHLWLGTSAENIRDRDEKGRGVRMIGADNPNTKLSDADVIAIRARRASGEKLKSIAKDYGTTAAYVLGIVTLRKRKYVTP